MGEKIRDIREIKLINSNLMVELNKGTTNNPEDLIHIQNKKFRYLLTVTDFMKVSADIMRAKTEYEYIKSHMPRPLYEKSEEEVNRDPSLFTDICRAMKASGIEYRAIECSNNMLTVIVKPDNRKKFEVFAKKEAMKKFDHPYGKRNGFGFLYKMYEFGLYKYKTGLIEVFYQLPSLSMTPKKWIPLDLHVQWGIWEKETEGDINWLDDETAWLYRMTTCIFAQVKMYEEDVEFFKKYKEVPFRQSIAERLELCFFGFTDRLKELLRDEKYEEIVHTFYTYQEY